jgi:hypothetical protein
MTNIGNMYGPDFTFLGIPRCDLDKPETYKGAGKCDWFSDVYYCFGYRNCRSVLGE